METRYSETSLNYQFTNTLPPPPDYDPDDHPSLELLHVGEIATWLRQREAILGKRAKANRLDAESSKTVSFLLLLLGGITASTNPLAWIPFIGAAIGYSMTLFQEKQTIDRIHPIPFYRGSLIYILHAFQNGGMGMVEDATEFEEKASYLNAEESAEFFLLGAHLDQLGAAIASFPPYVRFDAYRYWVSRFWRSHSIAPAEEVQGYILSAVSKERLNCQPPDKQVAAPNPFEARQLNPASQAVSGVVGVNTRLNAIEVSTLSNTLHEDLGDAGQDIFPWADLADGNNHPMIALIGSMNAGKSRTIKWLAKHILFGEVSLQDCDAAAFDIFGTSWEWEEEGIKRVHRYSDMVLWMAYDLIIVKKRLDQWQNRQPGQTPEMLFSPMLRILEEYITTFPELEKLTRSDFPDELRQDLQEVLKRYKPSEIVDMWRRKHGSETRKLRSRAIFISTELVASELGMTAGKRSAMTLLFPGEAGIFQAMSDSRILGLGKPEYKDLRERLQRQVERMKHPCLVFSLGRWMVADVPELDEKGNPVVMAQPVPAAIGATMAVAIAPNTPSTATIAHFDLTRSTAIESIVNGDEVSVSRAIDDDLYNTIWEAFYRAIEAGENPLSITKLIDKYSNSRLKNHFRRDQVKAMLERLSDAQEIMFLPGKSENNPDWYDKYLAPE
jgi:hypothetical protein